MQTQWISSSTSLPLAGKAIQFLLVGRQVPLAGTYTNGLFHAHWSDYDADRVEAWCPAEDESA